MRPTIGANESLYVQLPSCIDQYGHRFTIPPAQNKAVCTRCGMIREQADHE
ncbi:hypothetical protein I5I01_gp75 [Mycobacterium phage MooMoo]|uniref:Uncharacterized protein n=1 Tax=Mycobacterium phage MooMoo TaxID=2108127 RepID=A0A2P1JRC0_9CAUD|nr:hypothetical protein I5I01_gp75 [Mycobacterium phage MooMoo]AVO21680.1 hypothetical protein SEA_MOOMOO_75 [Mycobacterium phage MooMoo]